MPNFLSAIMPKRKSGSTSNRGKGKASKRQKGQTAKEVTSPTNSDFATAPPNQATDGAAQPATGEPVILSQNQIVTGQDEFPTGGQVMVSSQDMQGKALGTQPSASGVVPLGYSVHRVKISSQILVHTRVRLCFLRGSSQGGQRKGLPWEYLFQDR